MSYGHHGYQVGAYEIGDYELGAMYELGAGPSPEDLAFANAVLSGAPASSSYSLGALAPGHMQPFQWQRPYMQTIPQPPPLSRPPMRVTSKAPSTPRVLFVGFDSGTDIAAGNSVNVTTQPQDVFSPRKVVIPATVAPNFAINDIRIGTISQLSSSQAIPAEAFLPDAMSTDVKFDTAQVSQQITMNVTNVSAAPARFRAAMNGFVARL